MAASRASSRSSRDQRPRRRASTFYEYTIELARGAAEGALIAGELQPTIDAARNATPGSEVIVTSSDGPSLRETR
jgi:hypothetical protein